VADKAAVVQAAAGAYGQAGTVLNAARRNERGELNDRLSAHIDYAHAEIGSSNVRTTTGFDVGAINVRLDDGRIQVSSAQLARLDAAGNAISDVTRRYQSATQDRRTVSPDDVSHYRANVGRMTAAERAQRIATMTALTQGAIAALSDSTRGAILPLTAGEQIAMGHVTAHAVAIRRSVEAAQGPEGDALRRLYADRATWTSAWTSYLAVTVDGTGGELARDPTVAANLRKAREYLAQMRSGR
jgi:hypothetical protein